MLIAFLQTKIKSLPEQPGVYLMKNEGLQILYVGKAKNLKARVSQYFQTGPTSQVKQSPRIELLVQKIADIDYVVTDNEVEALILEFNLIKKHRPKFNVRLKDDKSYPYIRLDSEHKFPKLEYVRRVKKGDRARYFGPYVSAFQIKDVLYWAQKAFKLRDCSDNEFRNRSRPCILHQMGQCSAPCVGLITEEDYHRSIDQALKLLDGKTKEVIDSLKSQMTKASTNEDFELAAELRDRMKHIEAISQEQKMLDPESEKECDLVQFSRQDSKSIVALMHVREGKTVGVFQFPFEDLDPDLSNAEFIFNFLSQYYLERSEKTPELLPKEVLIPETVAAAMDSLKVLTKALGKSTGYFRIPKRGPSNSLIEMLKKTADYHLEEFVTKKTHSVEDLIDVQRCLDLKNFPHRMECYDISHFQGAQTVASRAVFIEGRPEKDLYRRYHVESAEGEPDDFKSLREVLFRRFSGDSAKPDLVVIDGGKGQLAQAEVIFSELQVKGVDLVSIAKSRTEKDFASSEVVVSMERIFKPNQKNPILLKPGTGAHRMLTAIRDESHRFAIDFHRQTRKKRMFRAKTKA